MVKRKFDSDIKVSFELEEPGSDKSSVEASPRLDREVDAREPTVRGPVEGVTGGHIDTHAGDMVEGDDLDPLQGNGARYDR